MSGYSSLTGVGSARPSIPFSPLRLGLSSPYPTQVSLQLLKTSPGSQNQIRALSQTSSAHNATQASAPAPRATTFRARPVLFTVSFLLIHQLIATGSLVPAYYWFNDVAPGSANALLAGPTTAWALKQPLPWSSGRTVEDAVEAGLRRTLGGGWSAVQHWRERRAAGKEEVEEDSATGEKKLRTKIFETWTNRKQRLSTEDENVVIHEALEEMEGREGKSARWRDRIVEGASGLRMRQVVDFAAAYLVVKVSITIYVFSSPSSRAHLAGRFPSAAGFELMVNS
jgi:hypothetical protein